MDYSDQRFNNHSFSRPLCSSRTKHLINTAIIVTSVSSTDVKVSVEEAGCAVMWWLVTRQHRCFHTSCSSPGFIPSYAGLLKTRLNKTSGRKSKVEWLHRPRLFLLNIVRVVFYVLLNMSQRRNTELWHQFITDWVTLIYKKRITVELDGVQPYTSSMCIWEDGWFE